MKTSMQNLQLRTLCRTTAQQQERTATATDNRCYQRTDRSNEWCVAGFARQKTHRSEANKRRTTTADDDRRSVEKRQTRERLGRPRCEHSSNQRETERGHRSAKHVRNRQFCEPRADRQRWSEDRDSDAVAHGVAARARKSARRPKKPFARAARFSLRWPATARSRHRFRCTTASRAPSSRICCSRTRPGVTTKSVGEGLKESLHEGMLWVPLTHHTHR